MRSLNVFSGQESVKDFLRPNNLLPTPLVEIPATLNPFYKDGVRIYAKLMNTLPLQNVKSLPAYEMLSSAQKSGRLRNVYSLIENSSGNTAFSLAVLGRMFGIPKTTAIVSHEVSPGKLKLLRLFNTSIRVNKEPICPDPNDLTSGIHIARRTGDKTGWFNPSQYDNVANPAAHRRYTGPQIWKQTRGRITVFCAGLGTTGTLVGAGNFLKKASRGQVTTVGVVRAPNNPVPGVRTNNLLKDIAFDWQGTSDHLVTIDTKASFIQSLKLCRAGIIAGPSSGFALAGLLSFLKKAKRNNTINSLRNKNNEVLAVFVCPDNPSPYLDEYFNYLPSTFFPKIINEELLLRRPKTVPYINNVVTRTPELEPREAFKKIYNVQAKILWRQLENGETVNLNPDIRILDIRSLNEFNHAHLPGSVNISPQQALALDKNSAYKKARLILLVCESGERTKMYAQKLTKHGLPAFSLRGGIQEWSQKNLPRFRPTLCLPQS